MILDYQRRVNSNSDYLITGTNCCQNTFNTLQASLNMFNLKCAINHPANS